MIAIIDYNAGNLTSVERALKHLNLECRISKNPRFILGSEKIIFPGVGAAGAAMADLKRTGMAYTLRKAFMKGIPILGICLGTQIIFSNSEENNAKCLDILEGTVRHFPSDLADSKGNFLKVPHMGWNSVDFTRIHPILEGINKESEFYFVHSYFPWPKNQSIIYGWTEYGINFPSVISYKNLFTVQFHPEKSGPAGLKLLENFCLWKC